MKHAPLVLATLTALLASPSVFAGNAKKNAEVDAQARASAQTMVDESMARSLQNIDQSLNVLVGLNRGGEPPRVAPAAYGNMDTNALAPTVAGAARKVEVDERVAVAPVIAPPQTATEKERAARHEAELDQALDRRVDISWNGSAYELLNSLSKQIGYQFAQGRRSVAAGVVDPRIDAHVKVSMTGVTVREVLQSVATQVEGKADVFVSVPERSISLLRK